MTRWITLPLIFVLLMASVHATALSITSSDYVAFEPDFFGPAWQVIVRGDNAPSYILSVPNDAITGEISGTDVQAQRGFQLQTDIVSESCDYGLTEAPRQSDVYVYRHELEATDLWAWNVDDAQQACASDNAVLTYITKNIVRYNVYCVYKDKVGITGNVGEGQMNFNAKFTLTKDDGTKLVDTISTRVTSEDKIPTSVSFEQDGDTVAIIKWIYGATSGEFCPDQDHVIAMQSSNKWYTANKFDYIEYADTYDELREMINSLYDYLDEDTSNRLSTTQISALDSKINENNRKANIALNEDYIRSGSNIASFDGATASLSLPRDHLIYAPDFQMLLKSDFLKVVYLTGRPRITASSFSDCAEGSVYNDIKVTIKNVGNAPGQFSAGLVCDDEIKMTTTRRAITLAAGESGTLTFPFALTLDTDEELGCRITVADTLNTANKDEATVTSECSASIFCTPEGEKVCRGETEFVCKKGQWEATGTAACETSKCDRDGICEADQGESFEICGGKTSPSNDCATCNYDEVCDATESEYSCASDCTPPPPPQTYELWMWIVIGIAVAVTLYLLITGVRGKRGQKSRRRR